AHVLLGHVVASPAALVPHVLFGDHAAGRVRDLTGVDLGDGVAVPPRLIPAVLLGDHPAGRVGNLPLDRVWHDPASLIRHGVGVGLADVMALLHGADLFARHPDALAAVVARALHLLLD